MRHNFMYNKVMKKASIVLVVFLIAVAVLINKGIVDEAIKPSALKPADQNTEDAFTVLVEEGNVYFGDGTKYTHITESEIMLPNNTFVKTEEGYAQIILNNNSVISLDKFTSIQITSEINKTKISQLYGNTWHRIQELAKIGEYRVESNNTIAAVRGTIFSFSVDKEGNSEVEVIENEVEVTKGIKRGDKWEVLVKQVIAAKHRAQIKNDLEKKYDVIERKETDEVSEWHQINILKDQQIKDLNKVDMQRIKTILKTKPPINKLEPQSQNQPNNSQVLE